MASWAAATDAMAPLKAKAGVQKTNPYEVPTYGRSGGGAPAPMASPQESTSNATPGYVPQAAPPPAAPPPTLPPGGSSPAPAAPSVSALSGVGLGAGFQDALMNEGWTDDAQTDLHVPPGRTLPASSRALQELTAQRRGRAY